MGPKFRSIKNGQEEELRFQVTGIDMNEKLGPLGCWHTNGLSPIAAIQEWLNSHCSKSGKGFVLYFEDASPKDGIPILVIQESAIPSCGDLVTTDNLNLGTFIVGATDSPVISFTPTIEYNLNYTTTGTMALQQSSTQASINKPGGVVNCNGFMSLNQGLRTAVTTTDNDQAIFGPDAGANKARNVQRNMQSQLAAMPFHAEMKIQGDPSFDRPVFCNGFRVSIVFPNPFTVFGQGRNCEWDQLYKPSCNADISGTQYVIEGVSHEIKGGYFCTTLKLFKAITEYSI